MNANIMLLKLFKWPLFFVALVLGLALGAEVLVSTWADQKLLAGALNGILPLIKYGLIGLAGAMGIITAGDFIGALIDICESNVRHLESICG